MKGATAVVVNKTCYHISPPTHPRMRKGRTILANNRRISDVVGTSTVYTVYNGDNVYADFNGSSTLTNRYLYGPAVDMIMAKLGTSATAWYLSDHQGSVRLLVDASNGSALDSITYDSYGNPTEQPASGNITYTMDRFKYTGREYDTALAAAFAGEADFRLQYNRARYYNPATGTFLSQDPLGFDAGDGNLYRYVGNGPTDLVDPSGLNDWWDEHFWLP